MALALFKLPPDQYLPLFLVIGPLLAGVLYVLYFLIRVIFLGEREDKPTFRSEATETVGEATNQDPIKNSNQKIIGQAVSSVIVLAFLGWLGFKYYYTVPPSSVDFNLSATELFVAYASDELAADAKYTGKAVQVNGNYTGSGISLGKRWVVLDGTVLSGVQCWVSKTEADRFSNIKKGTPVTVKGIADGKVIYANLVRCGLAR